MSFLLCFSDGVWQKLYIDQILEMEQSQVLIVLKICFILLFVVIVLFVGTLPLRMQTFKRNKFLKSMGSTFAGALFINVAIIHILPESADTIEAYLKDNSDGEVFPLAYLLVMIGFLCTIFFTRIVSSHSHSHDDISQPSKSIGDPLLHDAVDQDPQLQNPSPIETNQTKDQIQDELEETPSTHQDSYFLTVAIYFHTLFEGIAIGVQNDLGSFLSVAIAIAFHKWADALSMGIHYRNRNVPIKIAYGLIIGQAVLNAAAIGFGWAIVSLGEFVEAIFLSVSAGTFLAISTMQMLSDQLHHPQFRFHKFLVLVFSTAFVSVIWIFENAMFNQNDES